MQPQYQRGATRREATGGAMSFCQIVEFVLGYDMNKCTAFRVADEIVHY